MRAANQSWMLRFKDTGFIPEAEMIDRAGETAFFEYMSSNNVSIEKIIESAGIATLATEADLKKLKSLFKIRR